MAALCGVQLPPALKIRPVGSAQETLPDHPGLEPLERAGVCHGGVIDPEIADWVTTLGRADIEVDIAVTRPTGSPTELVGPPAAFVPPPIGAADALCEWNTARAPQRVVALCRRHGQWVAAARLWQPGHDTDEVVLTPIGPVGIELVVRELVQLSGKKIGYWVGNGSGGDWKDLKLTEQ